jgi:hypothetical protein
VSTSARPTLPSVPVAALAPISSIFSGTPYTQGFPQGLNTSGVTGVGASGGTGFDTGLFGAPYTQGLQQGTPYMQGLHDTLYTQGSAPSAQGNTYNVPGNPYASALLHTHRAVHTPPQLWGMCKAAPELRQSPAPPTSPTPPQPGASCWSSQCPQTTWPRL